MKPPNVGGAAKCRRWRKERRNLPRNLCKEGNSWQGWTERKGLAELLPNEKAMGPLLGFLKSTEVGGREGAKERELEWEQRDDRVGGGVAWDLRQIKSDSGGENPQMSRITPGETAQK